MMQRSSSAGGFTLLELMTVMGIMAVVMGLSFGAFQRLGQNEAIPNAERILRSSLNRARATALELRAPAELRFFDGETASVQLIEYQVAATLGFDGEGADVLLAGVNRRAETRGADVVEEGYLQQGLAIGNSETLSLPRSRALDPSRGFVLEFRVRPLGERGDGVVVRHASAVSLELSSDGSGRLTVQPEQGENPVELRTAPGCFAPDRWLLVRASFDGLVASLALNGVVEATGVQLGEDAKPVTKPYRLAKTQDARWVFGGGLGAHLDEVRLLTPGNPEPFQLAGGLRFSQESTRSVRFDAKGRLDASRHADLSEGPLVIEVLDEERSARLTIHRSGVLR